MAIKQTGNRRDNQNKWEQHVREWDDSGLSQKAYCEIHALPLQSFGYWKRKLKQPATTKPCFYPLTVSGVHHTDFTQGEAGLYLLLNKERFRVEINENFSAGLLKKLVVTLEQL